MGSAGRWLICAGGVGPVIVVVTDPYPDRLPVRRLGLIGVCVGATLGKRLLVAFGLPVVRYDSDESGDAGFSGDVRRAGVCQGTGDKALSSLWGQWGITVGHGTGLPPPRTTDA